MTTSWWPVRTEVPYPLLGMALTSTGVRVLHDATTEPPVTKTVALDCGAVVVVVVGGGGGGGGSATGGVSTDPEPPDVPEGPGPVDPEFPPWSVAVPPVPAAPFAVAPADVPVAPGGRGLPVTGSITTGPVLPPDAALPASAVPPSDPVVPAPVPARSSDRRIDCWLTTGGRPVTCAATRSTALQATPHAPRVATDHTPSATDFFTPSLSPDSSPDLVKTSSSLLGVRLRDVASGPSWSRCS